jgi:hypothetical protein
MGHPEIGGESLAPEVLTETEKLARDLQAAFPELSAAAIERILRLRPVPAATNQRGVDDEDSTC